MVPDELTDMIGAELEDTRRTREPPVYEVVDVEAAPDAGADDSRVTLERVGGDDQAVDERTHTRDEFRRMLKEGTYVDAEAG